MGLDLTMLHPRCEVSQLSVVAVVRHPHFRPDVKNLVVVNDDATVVDDILVHHGPDELMST